MKAAILFIGLSILLTSCTNKNEFHITVEANETNYDTLIVREENTDRVLAKVPLAILHRDYAFDIAETTIASLSIIGIEKPYATVIRPGVTKSILIEPASIKTSESIPDSLLNYLRTSTNQMFATYNSIAFDAENSNKVKSLVDSLIQVRYEQLIKFKPQMTDAEFRILDYQNKAKAYGFLMFYGRMFKRYAPNNDFFGFVENIDSENPYAKSVPYALLYKYEIQILKEKDSIESIDDFLGFIETQAKGDDLQDFLKAIYLKSVIESLFPWASHRNLFTTNTLKAALQRESGNKYAYLITQASNSFNSSQKGMKGYDFSAFKRDGTKLRLSELTGKIVVIDAWATWCGPCIGQRPKMIELAKKYDRHPEIVFLFVSVDESIEKWKTYVGRTNGFQYGVDVNIPGGMSEEFGNRYLIKAIPKYILIGRDGVIINSTLPEPSSEMEELIERVIKHS